MSYLQNDLDHDLKNRFCPTAYSYAEIIAGGEVFLCCSLWTGYKFIGNIYKDSPEDIWNSPQAVAIRAGILDGSYHECDHEKCPMIFGKSLPTKESVRKDWYGAIMGDVIDNNRTVMDRGPLVVKLMHDASCNLTCPSCRNEMIMANKATQEKLRGVFENFLLPFMKDAAVVVLAGDGDPFASHHYRDIMIEDGGPTAQPEDRAPH